MWIERRVRFSRMRGPPNPEGATACSRLQEKKEEEYEHGDEFDLFFFFLANKGDFFFRASTAG
jgi:hypothetical protein